MHIVAFYNNYNPGETLSQILDSKCQRRHTINVASQYLLVITSVPSKTVAQKLTAIALNLHLAACVQVTAPLTSTYWWQKRIESSEERLCIFKTDLRHYRKLEQVIKQIHPYEIPEIIALPVITGSEKYLCWLIQELQPPIKKKKR